MGTKAPERLEAEPGAPFDSVYRSKAHPGRKHLIGKACRVLSYGATMHAAMVEFEDGARIVCSRRSFKRK